MTATAKTPALSPHVRFSANAQGAVLLNTTNGQMFTLNKVGERMVALLGEGLNLDAIAARIAQDFSAPTDRVTKDLADLVATLRSRGLLTE